MANLKKIQIYGFLFILAIILLAAAVYCFNSKIPAVIIDDDQINSKTAATKNSHPPAKVKTPITEAVTPTAETAPSSRFLSGELGTSRTALSAPLETGTSTPKKSNLLNLPIPFTPQAPTANWDLLHNEACEEAAAIMANAYLVGDRNAVIPTARVEKEIGGLTAWQDKNFGYHLNATAKETALMIEDFYGLRAEVFDNYTLEDIKNRLDSRQVVIIPINGQIIGNPNYQHPGPIYHMLVIRGYTSTGLITNDSGTRRGQNYPYAFKTLFNAGVDWDHKADTIDQSKKLMIVVSK